MIIALLKKEVRQNFLIFLGVLGLVALAMMVTGQFLARDSHGLMATGQLVCRAVAPVYCLLAAHRLFVDEYRQDTADFLAGLPVSLRTLTSIKLVLGATTTMGLSALIVVAVALAVSGRELVDTVWTLQIALQVIAYSFAWFGVSAGIAHLGKYRALTWTILVSAMGIAFTVSPQEGLDAFWFAGTTQSIELTRFEPPWMSMVVAIAWGAGGTIMAYVLSGLRGGGLVRRWYTEGSHRDLVGMAIGVALVVVAGVVAETIEPASSEASEAPSVNDGPVRILASKDSTLWDIGRALDHHLSAMSSAYGIDDWAPITVTYRPWDTESRAGRRGRHAGSLSLTLDPSIEVRNGVKALLNEVMEYRSHGLVTRTDWKGWILAGFAESWLGRDGSESPMHELRAAWAAREGVTVAELNSWDRLEGRFGPSIAAAVAWAGIQTVRELGGTAGVDRLVAQTLAPYRSGNGFGLLMERWASLGGPQEAIQAAAGVDWPVFLEHWQSTLRGMLKRRSKDLRGVAQAPSCEIGSLESGHATMTLSWSCESDVGISLAELLWSTASPLADYPVRGPVVRIVAVKGQTAGRAGIDVAQGSRPVATISIYVAELDARIVSGWKAVGL